MIRKLLLICCCIFLASLGSFAQGQKITGRVTATRDGLPMPGVNVSVKGAGNGAVTNVNGEFTLAVPNGASTLLVSFVGYLPKQVAVTAGQTNVAITLDEDVQVLSDVVVVGYSSKKRDELTSAVTVVSANKLKDVTANNIGTMLQGKVAGLQVVNSSGAPGSSPEIRLRGVSSVNANQSPLFVVDGIIGGNYDPNDVESITVLKDAASTALYGSQANAGVIIVTTKKAKQGETKFEAKVSSGFRTADFGKMNLMNSNELYDYQKEFYRDYIVGATDNSYKIDLNKFYSERPQSLRNQDYDWSHESFKTAPMYNFYLSASGRTEKNDYYVGASYYKEKGTFLNTDYQRINLRANSTYHFSKKLDITNNINLSGAMGKSYDYMDLYYSFLNLPWDNPYDAAGNPIYVDGNSTFKWWSRDKINPINTVQNSEHSYKGFDLNYDLGINYHITNWLTFASTNRVAAGFNKGVNYVSPVAAGTYHGTGYIDESNTLNYGIVSNQLLKFDFRLGDHAISGFAGAAFEGGQTEYSGASGKGLPEGLKVLNVVSNNQLVNGSNSKSYLQSLLSQLNYGYKDKYFLSASFRYDGSSAFAPSKQYGAFPSVSAAWLASKEDFLADNSIISNLKLRASYGVTGTQDIGSSRYLGLYSLTTQYNSLVGAVPYQLASPTLTWESKHQVNLGVDIGLFKRVNLTVDVYRNNTKNLLLQVSQPLSVGFETKWENAGNVINRGIEVGISSTNIQTKDFEWNTDFTINFNSNKLYGLPADIVKTGSWSISQIYRNGGNLYEFYMPKWLGVDAQTGAPVWEKLIYNAEGKAVASEKTSDYSQATTQEVGSALPKFQGGFNNSWRYKNFGLRVSTYFNYGNKVFSNNLRFMMNDGHEPYYNQIKLPAGSKIWSGPGDTQATEPSPQNSANSTETSTRYLKDGSYFTIRNIALNYTLPKAWAKSINMDGITVGLTADNVATFSNFLGQDPQTTIQPGSYSTPGVSDFKYPNNRQYLFTVNFNF
ncbi:SusC/RagA family TonB-linked outer membrane protein [Mucilaginibacter psychrotolerans]|uniref:SusC/RagA family TonB-linked outer membrane protein n=1 Tax=Mucilaginibacter psychrotolerans TaxID=1524096 RepID=A0A4Y8S7A2_9SPHI|nr:SusC/RagA family TonB-linked outer membrane protein [Mucilaginibacter psychrotolerans]TFF34475.1 SusC/RagA family TonB-linked outer membrane protein [Mucilaginibacter psychrotolerans]